MPYNMCVLKDHFTLPPEDSNARYLDKFMQDEQLLKDYKLKQFLITEQKRSSLYRSLIAKVKSNCIDEKLLSALPYEVNPPPPSSKTASYCTTSEIDSQRYAADSTYSGMMTGSGTVLSKSHNHGSRLPDRTVVTTPTGTLTTTINLNKNFTEMSIDNLSYRAKALSLHSFPYLLKSIELKASNIYERKARQMRQALGRRIYSDAERKKACLQRQNKEDIILSGKVKAKAEKHFHKCTKIIQPTNHPNGSCTLNISTTVTTVPSNASNQSTEDNKLIEQSDRSVKCNNTLSNQTKVLPNEPTFCTESIGPSNENTKQLESVNSNNQTLSLWNRLSVQLNKKIPPLCLCMQYSCNGDDTPPWLKCANNCRFYRRPEGMWMK
ncbi:unnamed protein product [Heterobilharzia americana]|nr:unnamed protein product [Heterobilharzia americana]